MYESLISGTLLLDNKVNKESDQKLNIQTIELKRENSQAKRSIITFYKDSDTSLWRSQAKLFFKGAKSWVKQTD